MTRPPADRTGAKALVRALRDLGAPRQVKHAIAGGPQGHDLARAVVEILAPAELVLLHQAPASARSRFRTSPEDLSNIAQAEPKSRDLILIGGGLETGELEFVRKTIVASAGLLKAGAFLATSIDTLAAPGSAPDDFDPLLFPQLAQQGVLGDAARARAPLPAAAWMLMLRDAGLEIVAERVAEQTEHVDRLMGEHVSRLAVYDRQELARGALHVLARKTGGPA